MKAKQNNMTREAFIRKWLGNPQKQYNEQCRDEMRDDLDLVIEAALRQPDVSGRSEQLVNFLLHLNDKELINNHDFDYEKEAKKYLKKLTNCH